MVIITFFIIYLFSEVKIIFQQWSPFSKSLQFRVPFDYVITIGDPKDQILEKYIEVVKPYYPIINDAEPTIPLLEEEFAEHIPGFFGKSKTASVKKQKGEEMLWKQRLEEKQNEEAAVGGKKKKRRVRRTVIVLLGIVVVPGTTKQPNNPNPLLLIPY